MNRRTALQVVGTVVGTLYGRTGMEYSVASGKAQVNRCVISLVLDDVSAIEVRYRGRLASIDPNILMDALGAPPTAKKKE